MTVLHKNGYVTGFKREDLPPAWIITAMRYLDRCNYISDTLGFCLSTLYSVLNKIKECFFS